MSELFEELERSLNVLNKIVFSSPGQKKEGLPEKITLQKQIKKDDSFVFLSESRVGNKALHRTLSPEEVLPFAQERMEAVLFRQVNLFSGEGEVAYRISKKGKVSRTTNQKAKSAPAAQGHNREKQYLIHEGDRVPFLVDLGVFTSDFKVVRQKYDKFRQINRFIELLDHAFCDFGADRVSVLDFGCGKSYLTFLVYYYFSVIKKIKVRITGYDLKADVVADCNRLAKKYGYNGLEFVVADVTRDPLSQETIDFVISLHACDVATDYALNFALDHKVPYIFSVPCCQHEINSEIKKGRGDLDLFLRHGLFQERMSALLTDAFRARILECEGYGVDVLEFVDFAHSPKNLMLRAKRKERPKRSSFDDLIQMEEKYGFRQTLLHLRKDPK